MRARLTPVILIGLSLIGCDGTILSVGEQMPQNPITETNRFIPDSPVTGTTVPFYHLLVPDPPLGTIDGARLYAITCSSCHLSLEMSTVANKTVADITRAMGTVSLMKSNRPVQDLSPSEIEAIADALMRRPAEPPPPSTGISFQMPLGNRFFVASKMKAIFAKGNAPLNQPIDSFINTLARVHGGVCNRTFEGCSGNEEESIAAQGTPTTNVLRAGYRVKACEAVLENDLAVSNALASVGLNSQAQRTAQNLDLVAELMISTPLNSVTSARMTQLDVALAAESSTDRWRMVLLSLCGSSLFEAF